METMMNINMCRCCASEGTFKDVHSTYHWMGEEEVYVDMLRDCFDISLSSSVEGGDGGICEVCITQLRNAANFKKQVLLTEEQFKSRLQNREIFFKHDIVKVEVSPEHEEDSENDNHDLSEDYSGTDYDIPIKKEAEEKPKKRTVTTRASTSRSKKIKTDDDEADEPETSKRYPRQAVKDKPVAVIKQENANKPCASLVHVQTVQKTAVPKKKILVKGWGDPRIELNNLRKGVAEVMSNSNATPIRCYGNIGYSCCFCSEQFPVPADLKQHTVSQHQQQMDYLMAKTQTSSFFAKMDITNLECKHCSEPLNTIETLIQHLAGAHSITVYPAVKKVILPFKFNSDNLQCCECSHTDRTFKMLQDHMRHHYTNHKCQVCDAGFVTKAALANHKSSHEFGKFKCSTCNKEFTTDRQRKAHMKVVHVLDNFKSKCGYCGIRLKDFRQRNRHYKEVHGGTLKNNWCNACDKVFSDHQSLIHHTKRYHLMVKTKKCEQCDKSFFSNAELNNHMLKHTGIRKFECDICHKFYGRKTTLQEHMRIHMNDRRFKCAHCGQAFVQKCSWKGHMRSKHGEYV